MSVWIYIVFAVPWILPVLGCSLPVNKLIVLGDFLMRRKLSILASYICISTCIVYLNSSNLSLSKPTVGRFKPTTTRLQPWESARRKDAKDKHLEMLRAAAALEDVVLPSTFDGQVEVSVLLQYWGGTRRTESHPKGLVKRLDALNACFATHGISHEVLINVDSPHIRDGDVEILVPALRSQDFLVLSNDIGETRAYNNLARMSRGRRLLFVQDDTYFPADCKWLRTSLEIMTDQVDTVGMLGFDDGILHVSRSRRSFAQGLLETAPRCTEPAFNVPIEAVPCAAMGPLFIPRSLFQGLNGFNESLSSRGSASSLLDCELSARVWLAGFAVVVVDFQFPGVPPALRKESHVAWMTEGNRSLRADKRMLAEDFARRRVYNDIFQGASTLAMITKGCQLVNALFDCSEAQLMGEDDCGIQSDTCAHLQGKKHVHTPVVHKRTDMKTSISLLMQYWGGSGRTEVHASNVAESLEKFHTALSAVSEKEDYDVFINVDSRNVRNGDVGGLLQGLKKYNHAYIVLAPNIHELRGYNRMAAISNAEYLIFLQDDDKPPEQHLWLSQPISLFNNYETIGVVSINQGLLFVGNYDEAKVGEQTLEYYYNQTNPYPVPRCTDTVSGAMLEAMRCADVGPLFVRRSSFRAVGGYNETATRSGEPGSVLVDCDLEARLWLSGVSTVFVHLRKGIRFSRFYKEHVAWQHPAMLEGHLARLDAYYDKYEDPRLQETQDIRKAAREMNAQFNCPREAIKHNPLTVMDCMIVETEATCKLPLSDDLRSNEREVLQSLRRHARKKKTKI